MVRAGRKPPGYAPARPSNVGVTATWFVRGAAAGRAGLVRSVRQMRHSGAEAGATRVSPVARPFTRTHATVRRLAVAPDEAGWMAA